MTDMDMLTEYIAICKDISSKTQPHPAPDEGKRRKSK